jgi:uncharacterized repeat protein (TIGR01451 family)
MAVTHSAIFTQGEAGATYSIAVSNAALAGSTTMPLTVTETLPAGLTLVSMSGSGWTCSANACTRDDLLAPGASYPPITVTVNVDPAAKLQITNTATLNGGGTVYPLFANDATTIYEALQAHQYPANPNENGEFYPCAYSISATDESFPAGGGTGTVGITTQSGCAWSVTNSLPWVTLTSPAWGAGSGTVTFQVAASTGAAQSGAMTIAGSTYIVEQVGATAPSAATLLLPQFSAGANWNTRLILTNTTQTPIVERVNFLANAGTGVAVPILLPQTSNNPGRLGMTFDRTIASGATLVIDTNSSAATLQTGSIQIQATGGLTGYGVLRFNTGSDFREALLPLQAANTNTLVLPYDHTGGYATQISLVNNSTVGSVQINIRDDSGKLLVSDTLTVPLQGQLSFDLATKYAATAGVRGTVELDGGGTGGIAAFGQRSGANGEITAVLPWMD